MSVAQKLVAWLNTKSEEWIDAQDGLGEIYADAQVEAAQQKMHPTLGESAASDSESKPAPKRVI